mmetsp:Transcript_38828/g.120939  ORF Transcript_38828/g.120939 Transcript_38828/m.120939 type:complete len:390 (+) Transcript_38828:38-1207(+)
MGMAPVWVGPAVAARGPAPVQLASSRLSTAPGGAAWEAPAPCRGSPSRGSRTAGLFGCAAAAGCAASVGAAAARLRGTRRLGRRGLRAVDQAAGDGGASGCPAPWSPPALVAAAVTGERSPKVLTAQQLVQRLFVQGKKSAFAPNAWYESPETTTNGQARVWQHWQVRPFRTIDRICDGKRSCGCTWTQLDGKRGASFFRFNQDGKVSFVREVAEADGWRKFKTNNMEALKPLFSVMGTIQNAFSFADEYLSVDREPLRPRFNLAAPRSRRADEVVQYLWQEAFCAEETPIDRVMAEYSDDAVFEDLTYTQEVFAEGKEAVRKYQEETKENAPEAMRFVLDEVSDGARSCTAVWHIEYGGQKSPRGVSFYEMDEAGKVRYVRASYDISF